MTFFTLSGAQADQFQRNGYLLVPALFSADEMGRLIEAATTNTTLEDHALVREDDSGRISKLTVWNHPGDDIFGRIARSERVVNTMERLLGDEVYHWHSKMMLKEPEVGGAWVWHQDYGYWYEYACLYPDLASCMIAVNRAIPDNGCLQVLKGSHHMGRIRPERVGHQIGADLERVEEAKKRHELVYCEMAPGDGLFFHSNLLHCSAANTSQQPRWVFICCYNARRNSPYKEDSRHPRYTPLQKVADADVIAASTALDAGRTYSTFKASKDKTKFA